MKTRKHFLFWSIIAWAAAIGIFAFAMRSSRAQSAVQPLSLKGVTITAAASDHPESNIENYGIAVFTGDYVNSKINWDWQQAGAKDKECIFIKHPWYYTYPSPGQPTWEKRSECDQNISVGSFGDIGEQTITLSTTQDPVAISFKVPKIPPSSYRADGVTRWRVRGGIRLYIDDQGNTYHSISKNAQGIFDYEGKNGVDLTFAEAAVPAQLAFSGPGAKCGNSICQSSVENPYSCPADCGQPKIYRAEAKFQGHGGSAVIGNITGNIMQLKNTGSDTDTFQITVPTNPENRCGLKLTAASDPGDWSTLPKTLDVTLGVNERKDVSLNCVTKDAKPGPLTFSIKTVSMAATAVNRSDVSTIMGEDQDTITLEEIVCSDPDNEDAWKISAYNQANPTAPQEPSVKGTTTGKNAWNTYVDSCKDLSTVWESSCGSQGPVQATVGCRYGCLDGRCRNKGEYDTLNAVKCGNKFECINNGVYGKGEYSVSGDRCIINGVVENLIKQCADDEICNAASGVCDPKPLPVGVPAVVALKQLFPGQYNNTKFSIHVEDPDGLKEFSLAKASGDSLYGGNPPSCMRSADSSTVTLEPKDFPLKGYVLDCRKGAVKYDVSVPNPNPTTVVVTPTEPTVPVQNPTEPTSPVRTEPQQPIQPQSETPSREEICKREIESLREEAKGFSAWLRDFERTVPSASKRAPSVGAFAPPMPPLVNQLRTAIANFETLLYKASSNCGQLASFMPEINKARDAVKALMQSSDVDLGFIAECRAFRDDAARRLKELEQEAVRSPIGVSLREFLPRFQSLVEQANGVCEKSDRLALDIARDDFQTLEEDLRDVYERGHEQKLDAYVQTQIEQLKQAIEKASAFPENTFFIEKLKRVVSEIETAYADGDAKRATILLEDAFRVRARIREDRFSHNDEQNRRREDVEGLLQNLEGRFSEEVIERIAEKVASKLSEKVTALMDAQTQIVAARIADFNKNIDTISQSLASVTVLAEEKRKEILEVKESILARAKEIDEKLEVLKIKAKSKKEVENVISFAATVNWCAGLGNGVKAKMTSLLAALEAGNLVKEDIEAARSFIDTKAEENKTACYEDRVSPYKDFHTHEWFFPAAVFNADRGFIRGRTDASGNPTGDFEPSRATLRIEALAMAMRIFEIPEGRQVLPQGAANVPAWGHRYINGARAAGIELDYAKSWDTPVTRLEAAEMLYAFARQQGLIEAPETFDRAVDYKDYARFQSDADAVSAVEALSDLGVFQGSNGSFKYDAPLLRSEFSAVNQRLSRTLESSSQP